MLITLAAAIGMVGVILSLVFTGWQTRELVRQTRIQNAMGDASAERESLVMLQTVLLQVMAEPRLRGYLFGGLPVPAEELERERVLTLAELMADALGSGIYSSKLLGNSQTAWPEYARYVARHSPAVRAVVDAHPSWWPSLLGVRQQVGPGTRLRP